mmetsp:Transcript_66873/g.193206  ORF Transcript_66873/g.193206 Transcript_66873/m.193206 type:complete len:421 (-) Transcript_66873:4519-5781(-)
MWGLQVVELQLALQLVDLDLELAVERELEEEPDAYRFRRVHSMQIRPIGPRVPQHTDEDAVLSADPVRQDHGIEGRRHRWRRSCTAEPADGVAGLLDGAVAVIGVAEVRNDRLISDHDDRVPVVVAAREVVRRGALATRMRGEEEHAVVKQRATRGAEALQDVVVGERLELPGVPRRSTWGPGHHDVAFDVATMRPEDALSRQQALREVRRHEGAVAVRARVPSFVPHGLDDPDLIVYKPLHPRGLLPGVQARVVHLYGEPRLPLPCGFKWRQRLHRQLGVAEALLCEFRQQFLLQLEKHAGGHPLRLQDLNQLLVHASLAGLLVGPLLDLEVPVTGSPIDVPLAHRPSHLDGVAPPREVDDPKAFATPQARLEHCRRVVQVQTLPDVVGGPSGHPAAPVCENPLGGIGRQVLDLMNLRR